MNTSDPNGIRTRVTPVKGECPRPLDDRVFFWKRAGEDAGVSPGLQAVSEGFRFTVVARFAWAIRSAY
jgi:hypothetical protein